MSIIDQCQTVSINNLVFRFKIVAANTDGEHPSIYVQIYFKEKHIPISSEGLLLPPNRNFNFEVYDLNDETYAKGFINYNISELGAGVWGNYTYKYENEFVEVIGENLLILDGDGPIPEPNPHPDPDPEPDPDPDPEPDPDPDLPIISVRDPEPKEVLIQNSEFFDLFHFTGLRRPGQIPRQDLNRYIFTQNTTPFYENLLTAASAKDTEKIGELAKAYLEGILFIEFTQIIEANIYELIELYEYLLSQEDEPMEAENMVRAETCFGNWLELPIKLSEFIDLKNLCINGINALMILYEESEIELLESLILVLRISEWAIRYLDDDASEEVYLGLKALVILPDAIFDHIYPNTLLISNNERQGYVRPLGIGELMIVREKPLSYEAGEIARIENVMKRSYHELREEDRLVQIEQKHQIQEHLEDRDFILDQQQHFDLGQELSNLADGIEEEFLFTAGDAEEKAKNAETGLTKTYSNDQEILSGGFTLDIKPNGNYTSQAIRFAKDLTGKVSRTLRQKRQESNSSEIQKEKSLLNRRIYDNKENDENITAIYRWVNKLSEARLINIGHRLIIEFVVPDPAKNFIGNEQNKLRPISPAEELIKNLSYTDITPEIYRELAAHYPVENIINPPKAYQYISASLQKHPLNVQTLVEIPEGYQATKAHVSAVYGEGNLEGFIGNTSFSSIQHSSGKNKSRRKGNSLEENEPSYQPIPPDVPAEIQSFQENLDLSLGAVSLDSEKLVTTQDSRLYLDHQIPLSVLSTSEFFNVNIDILCERKEEHLRVWQLSAYRSIIDAYEKQAKIEITSYQEERERKQERQIIINQLIQVCGEQLLQLIEPPPNAWEKGDFMRFVRQVFLWEEIVYSLYDSSPFSSPGSTPDWADDFQQRDNLPDFNQFLHAKAAKVHVAVRREFEQDALFLIGLQGRQWAGLNMDAPIKEHYLFYANELLFDHQEDQSEGQEIKTWNMRTPTHMQILQKDGNLPELYEQDNMG